MGLYEEMCKKDSYLMLMLLIVVEILFYNLLLINKNLLKINGMSRRHPIQCVGDTKRTNLFYSSKLFGNNAHNISSFEINRPKNRSRPFSKDYSERNLNFALRLKIDKRGHS